MRTDDDPLEAEERYHLDRIHELRLQCEAAIKPHADRLVYLRNTRPLPPIILTLEQALAAGVVPPCLK